MAKQQCEFLKYISYLQIIGIVMVVLGHSFHEYPDGRIGFSLWCCRLLYNITMPLFSFVSGYLLYYTSFMAGRHENTLLEFTFNKAKRLLVPFLFLSLVTFVPRSLLSQIADEALHLNFISLFHSLLFADELVIPFFWFLQMSFILLVLTFSIIRLAGKNDNSRLIIIFVLLVLFMILPTLKVNWGSFFALSHIVQFGMYFIIGVLYCRFSTLCDKTLRLSNSYTCLMCFAVWIISFFFLENYLGTRLVSLLGIIAFVTLAHIMENRNWNFLDHFKGANYIIFLLSWYPNILTQQVLAHFVVLPWWIHTCLSFLGGIFVPLWIYYLLQRNSDNKVCLVLSFLLGQNLKKNTKVSCPQLQHQL